MEFSGNEHKINQLFFHRDEGNYGLNDQKIEQMFSKTGEIDSHLNFSFMKNIDGLNFLRQSGGLT